MLISASDGSIDSRFDYKQIHGTEQTHNEMSVDRSSSTLALMSAARLDCACVAHDSSVLSMPLSNAGFAPCDVMHACLSVRSIFSVACFFTNENLNVRDFLSL